MANIYTLRGTTLEKEQDKLVVKKKPAKKKKKRGSLNVKEYHVYLNSAHWKKTSEEKRKINPRCETCDEFPVHIHHGTYQRKGREEMDDLFSLCKTHHKELHKLYLQELKSGSTITLMHYTQSYVETSSKV